MPIEATGGLLPGAGAAAAQATGLHTTGAGKTAEAKKTFDQEVFLALLVAQMRHQDPTSPMDTTDMMAQSTQLASMEQLTAVADTSRESFALQMRVAALGLVGQEVTYTGADGVARTGVVDEVSFATEVPQVRIGDTTVALDAVAGSRRVTTGATDGTAAPRAVDGATTPAMDGDSTPTTPASGDGSAPAA